MRPGIAVHRLVRPAMDAPIPLLVALQTQRFDPDRGRDRHLGDGAAGSGTRISHGLAGQDGADITDSVNHVATFSPCEDEPPSDSRAHRRCPCA